MLTYKDLLLTGPEAVCVLDADLSVIQHNQLAGILLGYQERNLIGHHLADILYSDILVRHLLSSDDESDWLRGECILRTSSKLPLTVKFRAASAADDGLPASKEYILVFSMADDSQHLRYDRQIKSIRFLMDVISRRDMESEDILLDFARIFDPHAEIMLLPRDFMEDKDKTRCPQPLLSQVKAESALKAMHERSVVLHHDGGLWCFFPVYSLDEIYGVACIKFAVPRLYSEEEKSLFSLAGMVLGTYTGIHTSRGQGQYNQFLLQTILDGIDQPIIAVNRDGIIALCNVSASNIYGYPALEMMGRSFGDLAFPLDSSIQYEGLMKQVMQGDVISSMEMQHLRRDLTMVDIGITAYPHKSADGLIIGAVFILRDLREKKHLWNKMVQWERLAVLGELLSSVANELNNRLTPMKGFSQLLRDQNNDEKTGEMIYTINEAAKRCSDIVHSVLNLARVDQKYDKYSNVNDVIIAAFDLKGHQLWENNIQLSVKLGEDIPKVSANPSDMECLFLRIINCAEQRMVEYSNGGRLEVESTFEAGNVVVRFKDTGTCIPKDEITGILDPFFIADEEDKWVSLGLSISYQILRGFGGNMRIENQIGKGNIVTVELPAVKEASSDAMMRKEENITSMPQTGKKVMVVDDEPDIVNLLVEVLHRMGHVSDVARDGEEAMRKLGTENYDLIVTDLRMPYGHTGAKLHKFIKLKNPDLAQRMIFITGDIINPETQEFLQSTDNPYLEKPFSIENLQDIIQRALTQR